MNRSRASNRAAKRPGRGQEGFSLLEVMIALVLTGAVVVALLQLTRAQMNSQAAALDRLAVLDQAGELMNQWLSAPQLAPGVYRGRAGSADWTVEIIERVSDQPLPRFNPDDIAGASQDPAGWDMPPELRRNPATIYIIKVCGRWRELSGPKELCLESERIAPQERRTF